MDGVQSMARPLALGGTYHYAEIYALAMSVCVCAHPCMCIYVYMDSYSRKVNLDSCIYSHLQTAQVTLTHVQAFKLSLQP